MICLNNWFISILPEISVYYVLCQVHCVVMGHKLMTFFKHGLTSNVFALSAFGYFCGLLAFALVLIALTEAFDKAYQALQDFKEKLKDQLCTTNGIPERRAIKCQISKIDDIRPMNACGYFVIEKSTLTSMLSIRLLTYKNQKLVSDVLTKT